MKKRQHRRGNDAIIHALSTMPRKIATMRDRHNIAEFVIHELCCENCFNITRAAYFVDNPDFDCVRGITGFCHEESFGRSAWDNPDEFTLHMSRAPFNQKVRAMQGRSCNKQQPSVTLFDAFAHDLGMRSYAICDVHTLHDNYGYFIYEQRPSTDTADTCEQECLLNGVSLLSFCPLY
jgi:hypothetical protein